MDQVGHRGHVDRRIGSMGSKHVLSRTLPNVGLKQLDSGRGVRPPPPIDSDHLVAGLDKLQGRETPELSSNSCD
jgi:hypothetical protein